MKKELNQHFSKGNYTFRSEQFIAWMLCALLGVEKRWVFNVSSYGAWFTASKERFVIYLSVKMTEAKTGIVWGRGADSFPSISTFLRSYKSTLCRGQSSYGPLSFSLSFSTLRSTQESSCLKSKLTDWIWAQRSLAVLGLWRGFAGWKALWVQTHGNSELPTVPLICLPGSLSHV